MEHEEIIEKCLGCGNMDSFRTCRIYWFPYAKWNAGRMCPMATHVAKKGPAAVKALDPIKASKKMMKGGK